jgi:hypothetical protein
VPNRDRFRDMDGRCFGTCVKCERGRCGERQRISSWDFLHVIYQRRDIISIEFAID